MAQAHTQISAYISVESKDLVITSEGSSLLLTLINFEQGSTVDLTPFRPHFPQVRPVGLILAYIYIYFPNSLST